ncbi:MAG: hypothetical protein AAFO69_10515 [Bacteroidota bacterium]
MMQRIIVFSLIAFCILLIGTSLIPFSNDVSVGEKINGVNYVSGRAAVSERNMKPVTAVGADYLSVIPYAFTRGHRPNVSFNISGQWYGETIDGTINIISEARKQGLKIMLKPHIWVMGDGWAGEFTLDNEEDWQQWEASFDRYILTYAKLADSLHVEIFCMATEFRMVVRKRPDYWNRLIPKIRSVYRGKLTYAANWDNYQQVQFWDQLDYIGIDAYFPLVHATSAEVDALRTQWQSIKKEIRNLSMKYKKPVLFTEYGYQSVDYGAGRHWEINQIASSYNATVQKNAYQALFEEFWAEKWFAGGFLWKWFPNHLSAGGKEDKRFTPQNKPAEQVVKEFYKKYNQ